MTLVNLEALIVLFVIGIVGAAVVDAAVSNNGTTVTINNYAR